MYVNIKTPSRLHFGIIDLNGNLGRLYGSVGVAIEKPNFVLEIEKSKRLEIIGGRKSTVLSFVRKFSRFYKIDPKVRIELKETIPEHAGLGSGTQLGLAVAASLSQIYGLGTTTRELASIMNRGILSGIGIAAFERGGFVVDSGINVLDPMPPKVVLRHSFPRKWSFIVAIPKVERGPSGSDEKGAFSKVIPANERISADLCRTLHMKMLPSLIDKDIHSFGQSVTEMDQKTGLYFKHVQKGIHRESESGKLVGIMLDSDFCYGAGQSSWGPSVYGLTQDKEAEYLENELWEFINKTKIKADIFSVNANNKGASIEVHD